MYSLPSSGISSCHVAAYASNNSFYDFLFVKVLDTARVSLGDSDYSLLDEA